MYKWCLLGAWHSAVAFGGWYMAWPDAFSDAGAGLQAFGAVVAATSVLIVNLKVQHKLLQTHPLQCVNGSKQLINRFILQ